MRRLAVIAALLLALCHPCAAQFKGGIGTPGWVGSVGGGGGGCSDSNATAWKNAVIAASGTVSNTQYTNVCTLIQAYKTAGVWSLMDRVWLLASENTQQASIDLVAQATTTIVSSPTFTTDVGYTADASPSGTTGINTNFTPSTAGGHYAQNSAHFSVYIKTGTPNGNNAAMGDSVSGAFSYIEANTASSAGAVDINGGTFPGFTDTGAFGVGQYLVSRTSSTNMAVYKNGNTTPIGSSSSDGSNPLFNIPFYLFYINGFGHNASAPFTLAAATIGGGMTSTQMQSAMSAMNAYQTAIGNNVY